MNTLLLDLDNWDLVIDSAGNIAMASDPYSIAQDVASACRTVLGEVWYDTADGIPYFQQILGKTPPATMFQEYMALQAETVPGVDQGSAACVITALENRQISGQITFTVDDETQTVAIQ